MKKKLIIILSILILVLVGFIIKYFLFSPPKITENVKTQQPLKGNKNHPPKTIKEKKSVLNKLRKDEKKYTKKEKIDILGQLKNTNKKDNTANNFFEEQKKKKQLSEEEQLELLRQMKK